MYISIKFHEFILLHFSSILWSLGNNREEEIGQHTTDHKHKPSISHCKIASAEEDPPAAGWQQVVGPCWGWDHSVVGASRGGVYLFYYTVK